MNVVERVMGESGGEVGGEGREPELAAHRFPLWPILEPVLEVD